MIHDPSTGRRDIDLTSLQTTRYGVRRRKNQPIPLPIPVPNLNKKSRGRKVPHISNDTNRTFVCVVSGCGKCFVRSEHLKRHVRSIHTNDKPHPCPFEGCDKSFSRRDNLGQHVRIHLQS
ncbi:hypothetical protein BYT27DRAFT_7125799 [Phlegmacium glaucopus]|nr:hypothetical protein BYT27DRAFT_7125799 [Phlegmacium glaucopus]